MIRAPLRSFELGATPSSQRRRPSAAVPRGGILGRYLLLLLARPFCGTLLIVLPALLLERLLRLFDLIATENVPAGGVLRILVDLVPHYLGLALPAALFIGVYFVVARLSAGNELDAMQNAGFSLAWISRPFLLIGVVVAIAGFGLYGYLQPYSRYAYRAAFQAATEGGWNATIPTGEMTHVSKDLVVTADKSGRMTGRLRHVMIYQRQPDGSERVTTARTGQILLSPDGGQLLLKLENGIQMEIDPDQADRVQMLTSRTTTMLRPFVLRLSAFRARGIDEREMSLNELWAALYRPPTGHSGFQSPTRRQMQGEMHGRLIRSLSLALLPLLAVPFGLSAKRARRQNGIVVGVLILVLYYHAIEFAQSLGTAGLIDPRPALWGAFALFAGLCVSTFRRAGRHTSAGPLDGLLTALDLAGDAFLRGWRSLYRGPARSGPNPERNS